MTCCDLMGRFEVRAVAMHDIAELVIFRNNKIVHCVEPGGKTGSR